MEINDPELFELRKEYERLLHAMQTGVAYELERDPRSATPKHLRVGVNAAMSDHSALAILLVRKGVITMAELYASLIEFMKHEVETYQSRLENQYGVKVTLH